MAGGAEGDGDAFAFDGADGGGEELAEGVGADEDGVAGVDDALVGGFRDSSVGRGRREGLPLLTTPEMTVPTKGTEKVSLMWNSKGALSS